MTADNKKAQYEATGGVPHHNNSRNTSTAIESHQKDDAWNLTTDRPKSPRQNLGGLNISADEVQDTRNEQHLTGQIVASLCRFIVPCLTNLGRSTGHVLRVPCLGDVGRLPRRDPVRASTLL